MATISKDPYKQIEQFQATQSRRSAAVATLVALYLRSKVKIEDPEAVRRFLNLMIPKVMATHEANSRDAAIFANQIRKIEVPKGAAPFEFEPLTTITPLQIERSIIAVGVKNYSKKAKVIRELPDRDPLTKRGYDKSDKTEMLRDAKKVSSDNVAGAVQRLTLDGGRQTMSDGAKNDPRAIGYVRVVNSDKPCYFCITLASRGLDSGGVYQEDSFDLSDVRFTGPGTAKVHDNCSCTMVPIRSRTSPLLDQSNEFQRLWYEYGSNDLNVFRKNLYEAGITKHR